MWTGSNARHASHKSRAAERRRGGQAHVALGTSGPGPAVGCAVLLRRTARGRRHVPHASVRASPALPAAADVSASAHRTTGIPPTTAAFALAFTAATAAAAARAGAFWLWVVGADVDAELGLLVLGHEPGLMNAVGGDLRELRHPRFDVIPVGVVILGLLWDVELVDTTASKASGGHPVPPVGACVVIQEDGFKVVRALAPIDLKVQRQITGDILPPAVGHPAGLVHLPHVGIDQGMPRLPFLPPPQRVLVIAPRLLLTSGAVQKEDPVPVLLSKEAEEVAPDHLKDDPISGLVGDAGRLVGLELVVDLAGGQAPEGHPGGELGAVVPTDHPVACLEVLGHTVTVPEVVLEALEGGGLPALEGEGRAGVGGGGRHWGLPRQVLEGGDMVQGPGALGHGGQGQHPGPGRGQQRPGLDARLHLTFEWREAVRHIREPGLQGEVVQMVQGGPPFLHKLGLALQRVGHLHVDVQLLAGDLLLSDDDGVRGQELRQHVLRPPAADQQV
mmetsp:Transcript_31198/g.52748  ORF Transcript_31198/g.52748 Transcript_31198/m.52748 type:complete len:503 (+) Transcript_31198:132-1640(+)